MEELYRVAKLLDGYAYIAGGFYKDIRRGIEPKDIDVFCISQASYEQAVEILKDYTKEEVVQNAVSISIGKFELIKPVVVANRSLFGKPEELVATFDISIAKVWIDAFFGLESIEHIEQIDKCIDEMQFDVTYFEDDNERTENRVLRYESYGFSVRNTEYKKAPLKGSSMTGGY